MTQRKAGLGTAIATTVNMNSPQYIQSGGVASGTTVNRGGTEYISSDGTAQDVTFGGTFATLDLGSPSGLTGTISNWQVGDTIDFVNTSVTSANISGSTLTITTSGDLDPSPDAFLAHAAAGARGCVPGAGELPVRFRAHTDAA